VTEARRSAHGRQLFGVERLYALSDGMFAIVLTLLVLDLKLPEVANPGDILDDLADNYHDFLAWLISFVVIARFWVTHQGITARMSRCHVGTVTLNFVLLAFVTLMPFTASLIGTYKIEEPWSTVCFAINMGAASIGLGLFARHVTREPNLLAPDTQEGELDWHRRQHLYVLPAVVVAAVGLAFVEPFLAIGLILAEFGVAVAAGSRQA
jgi:uncharacterized membrane protein